MPLLWDSKSLIPAPFVTIRKQHQKAAGGVKLGSTLEIVLRGKLVSWKGSPNSAGTFHTASGYPADETSLTQEQRFASVLAKQKALMAAFAEDGKTLEIQPWDGSTPTKYVCRVRSVEFPDGEGKGANWTEYCDYQVTLESDGPDDDPDGVQDASEEWSIEPADDRGRTFRLTHSLSATGKRKYDETGALVRTAWEAARLYVLDGLGLGLNAARMEAPGVLDASSLQAFNYVRTQSVNELAGTFAATETWLCYDPQGGAAAVEEFTVTTRVDESRRVTVSIDGNIQGLEVRDNNTRALSSTRATNASAKWVEVQSSLHTRCQNLSGVTLNSVPVSYQVGQNEAAGTLTYNYVYDDRPTPDVVGAVSQSVTVNDTAPPDVFATVPVLGRALGPVLQSVGTVGVARRSISIEVVMPVRSQSYTPTAPGTAAIVLSLRPVATQVFVDQDEESWNPYTGRYSRQTTFTYQ